MSTIQFQYLNKSEFSTYASKLFAILHANMSVVAPTGKQYDEECELWCNTYGKAFMEREQRRIVLIKSGEELIGFFGYTCNESPFRFFTDWGLKS